MALKAVVVVFAYFSTWAFKAIISGLVEASLSLPTVFKMRMRLDVLSVRRRGLSCRVSPWYSKYHSSTIC